MMRMMIRRLTAANYFRPTVPVPTVRPVDYSRLVDYSLLVDYFLLVNCSSAVLYSESVRRRFGVLNKALAPSNVLAARKRAEVRENLISLGDSGGAKMVRNERAKNLILFAEDCMTIL